MQRCTIKRYKPPKLRNQVVTFLLLSTIFIGAKITSGDETIFSDPELKLTQYIQRSWSMDDGLPSNNILDIAQTQDGYLWLATSGGLVRFDGLQPKVFNLLTNPGMGFEDFTDVEVGPEGSLWIGTLGGGGLIEYKEGQFSRHIVDEGTNPNILTLLFDASGRMWIGTNSGLYVGDETGISEILAGPDILNTVQIRCLFQDATGQIWIGTYDAGLFSFRDGSYTSYTTEDGLSSNNVEAVLRDRNGVVWIGTAVGLDRMDPESTIRRQPLPPSLEQAFGIWTLIEDRHGRVWFGTNAAGGLGRIDRGRIQLLNTVEGNLPDDRVRSIHEDRDGAIWVGLYGGGLTRLQEGPIRTYTLAEGLAEKYVTSVFEDPTGTLWLTTGNGYVQTVKNSEVDTVLDLQRHQHRYNLYSVAVDSDAAVWLGTDKGLVRFADGKFRNFTAEDGLPGDRVRVVYVDPIDRGILWLGTVDKGLCRFSDGEITSYDTSSGLSNNNIRWILRSRTGVLWIGTEAGLNRLENGQITTLTTADGLPTNTMRSGHETDDGTLWFGTSSGGIVRYRDESFTTFSTSDGLLDNSAWCILGDRDHLWASSDRGIQRVSKSSLEKRSQGDSEALDVRLFGTSDGMKSNECNGIGFPTGWQGKTGQLWFPTMHGVVRVEPNSPLLDPEPPPAIIESVRAESGALELVPGAVLPAGNHDLKIEYTALAFADPQGVRFKYRLEGHDRDWIAAGWQRTAYYANLRPGDYTFHVISINRSNQSSEVVSFSFEIEPHMYQLWWFLPLVGSTTVGFLYWLMLTLLNRQKLKTAAAEADLDIARRVLVKRTRFTTIGHLAANIANDVKNPLGAARNSVFYLKRLLTPAPSKVDEHLKIIDNEIGKTINTIEEIITMSRESDPMKRKVDLSMIASEVFSRLTKNGNQTHSQLKTEPVSFPIFVDPAQFSRVLRSLMSNALQATEYAGTIRLRAHSTAEFDVIRISDDGPGIPFEINDRVFEPLFTTKAKGPGLGLAICREIIERHGGTISLVDPNEGSGSGATFEIRLTRQQPETELQSDSET